MIRVLNVSTSGHTFFCLWEDLRRVGRGLLRVWHYNHQYQTPHRPLNRRHFSRPHTLLGAKKHLYQSDSDEGQLPGLLAVYINPLTSRNDQERISPNNINTISTR